MTDNDNDTDDELYAEAIAAWDPGVPSAGLAKRLEDAPVPARWRGAIVVASIAAALVVAVVAMSPGGESGVSGSVLAQERASVELGAFGVLVAEPGAELRWSESADAGLVVEQSSGRALYRVAPGAQFEVATPAGVARVAGTVFEVEIEMNKKTLTGVSAALAAAAVVTVYEGRVVFANDQGSVDVDAGQSVRAEVSRPPGEPSDRMANEETERELSVLRAQSARQQREIERLRAGAAEARRPSRDPPSEASGEALEGVALVRACAVGSGAGIGSCLELPKFETDEAALQEMARCGTVVWDQAPPYDAETFEPSPDFVRSYGLSPEDAEAIAAANASFDRDMTEQLAKIYAELTGEESPAGSMGRAALFSAVRAKIKADVVDNDDSQRRYRAIARERAGLSDPPERASMEPSEWFQRLTVDEGELYMEAVAEQLGSERAKALRRKKKGWPSSGFAAGDCGK